MSKRSQRVQDEENEDVHVASGKRSRTVDSEDDEGPPPTRQRREPNGTQKKNKGKAKAVAVEEDEEDEDVVMSDAEPTEKSTADLKMNDEEFENTYGPQVRDAIDKIKNRPNGAVAEHGIIEYIEMHQFMCHVYLRFTFGPQINFIIGHNGSGKSAVLSAITVALGGKSTSTGRGTGLKSFIREGQQASEVSIHIKNQGDEAYKPKDYGDSIIVTRKFNKNGGSSWEIKSKAGKVISKKQEELAAICDHMNIQVDNPMTVLTQDSARQFLSASAPADKYKFFLSGTQLSQLSEEYEACMANINATGKLLAVKKEALPDLEARLREASARYEEANKARVQRERLDELKRESAWSLVAAKEVELTKQIQEVAKLTSKLGKIDRDYEKAVADVELASNQVLELEAQLEELGEVKELLAQRTSLNAEIRANKSTIVELNSQRKDISNSVSQLDQQILGLEQQVEVETQKMATKTQAVIEKRQEAMKMARDQQNQAQAGLDRIIHDRVELGKEADALRSQGMDQDRSLQALQNSIQECDSMISSARQHDKDALTPYGSNIKQVLEKVRRSRWHGETPIGPLGTYIKAREPEKWGHILRSQLGSSLTAFAVTDARDRDQLSKILQEFKNPHVQIIISERDLFDYRNGEPHEGVLTVLRALEISDQFVLRILINQNRIEGQVLSETRREAEQLLRQLGGGSAYTLDRFNVRVFPEGGSASSPLNLRNVRGSMNLLLTGRDTQSEIQHHEYEKQRLVAQYQELRETIDDAKAHYHNLKTQIENLNKQEHELNKQVRVAKQTFNTLQQEANEDMPVDIGGLYGAIEEAQAEKANILVQFEELEQQRKQVAETQTALQHALNDVKRQVDEHEGKRGAIGAQIEEAITLRVKAQSAKGHWQTKQESERSALQIVQANADVLQIEFTDWSTKASEFCDPFDNPRKYEVVQRHIESVSKALKERERRQGASVEDLAKEVNKAKENYDHTKQELKQMHQLNRALKDSLLVRLVRWQEFRRHIALRCKGVFQYHLSQRGYYGKILFDHEHQTLTLRVQTDDQLTSGNKDKDPKSLSGGEKSFSTICLLLALWESIGCPLRCLDEFDVFMDAVNRRISMKMMIDTANTSDKKQYVLITPQEMTNVSLGPSVKVHKMADPERGGVSGRLNFAS